MDRNDMLKLEEYLRKTLKSPTMKVMARPKKKDSAEVFVGEEFIGVLSEDTEDGDKSYFFEMAILAEDLE